MVAQARLDNVKMGVDEKGRPRSVCFVQLTSVVDSMSLHKSIVTEPLMIDNNLGKKLALHFKSPKFFLLMFVSPTFNVT